MCRAEIALELKWLEDFLALALTSNFSKAAEARHVTQPAFGRRIRALEHWVGVPLIDRSGYPMRLTDEGQQFRDTAVAAVASLKGVRDELRRRTQTDSPIIRFAALHTLALAFFPNWIARLAIDGKAVRCSMVADNMHDCVELLASGGCDFVLSYAHAEVLDVLDARRFAALTLGTDTLVAVIAPHQRAGLLRTLDEGAALPLLGYAPDTCLGQLVALVCARRPGVAFDLRYENSMAEGLKTMALTGAGMAWLPMSSITRELAAGGLEAVGDASWSIDMQITLHRRIEILRAPAEGLWTAVSKSIR